MPEYGAVKGWKNRIRIGLESAPNESIWHDGRDPLLNSLTMDTSVDIDKIFVIGSRDAVSMIEGIQEVTGSLERNLYSKNATYNEFIYAVTIAISICSLPLVCMARVFSPVRF